LTKFGQVDKWNFCLKAAADARVSGEMRTMLNVLDMLRRASPETFAQLRAPDDPGIIDEEMQAVGE
jgi:hypothetical protein